MRLNQPRKPSLGHQNPARKTGSIFVIISMRLFEKKSGIIPE
jgi:hypothetical protein